MALNARHPIPAATVAAPIIAHRMLVIALSVAALTAVPSFLPAQQVAATPVVTPADYARSAALDPLNLVGKLKNSRVVPHWIGERDEFWYQRDTPTGHDFLLVDASTGGKRPAFDHAALSQALTKAAGASVAAGELTVNDLTFAEKGPAIATTARMTVKTKAYDCKFATETVTCAATPPSPEGVLLSPDRKWGIETRDGNVWLRNMQSGEARALTTDGEGPNFGYGIYAGGDFNVIARERGAMAGRRYAPNGVFWSPDSRMVIVTRVDQRQVADYPFVESTPVDGSFRPKAHMVRIPLTGEPQATRERFVFDVPTGVVRKLEETMAAAVGWNADNRHLYVIGSGDNTQVASLSDVDLVTGKSRLILEERMTPRIDLNSTVYSPPNVYVTKDGRNVIWWSQRDGWGHLYLYDAATGALRNRITKGDWLVRDIVHVDEPRRTIYFTGNGREEGNPYYRYLYRVNFDGSGLTLLSAEPADHLIGLGTGLARPVDAAPISPSGKYVVYTYSTVDRAPTTVLRATPPKGRLIATLETVDPSGLYAIGYRPPEEFVVKAADGTTDLWGVFYKPSTFDSNRKYPVIDAEYTSPVTATAPRDFVTALRGATSRPSASMLAELGFVVVVVDARGTPFRSRDFLYASYGKLDILGLDDHIAAIKQLGSRFSYVDTARVGIWGISFGGWGAFRGLIEFPDFFKVGVAGSAPGSFHNMYPGWESVQGKPLYSDGGAMRTTPTEIPKNWNAVDSRQEASRLKGHLLILMGELDENVLPGSTLQFMDALAKANKDFDLIYLIGQTHVSGYSSYTSRRIGDYFVRHLMGATPPAWNEVSEKSTP